MEPRNLLVKHNPLAVLMQVDLRLHQRNSTEETKAIWLECKVSTESGKVRVGSIGKGWNSRVSLEQLDMQLLCRPMSCLNEAKAFTGVDK